MNDRQLANDYLAQIVEYTKEVCKYLDIRWDAKKRRNYRMWDNGVGPTGALIHYTASNKAVSSRRPLGRIPNLLRRFARNSGTPGVHFVVWDDYNPELAGIRAHYDVFNILPCDVFSWGWDVAYYHGNWANGWAFGIENRNVGVLRKRKGKFYWGGHNPYRGRDPIQVRGIWCEPFTSAQIWANILLIAWMRHIFPIASYKVVGHTHIISTKVDPFPSYPFHMVRDMIRRPLSRLHFMAQQHKLMELTTDPYYRKMPIEEDRFLATSIFREFMDLHKLYKANRRCAPSVTEKAITRLGNLGYCVYNKEAAKWSIRTFQERWVRKKAGRWVHIAKVTGTIDKATVHLIEKMEKQWRIK